MNILITGGNGFLGSNIVAKALIYNHKVCLVPRHTPNPENQIIEFNPDIVIHCAWGGGNNYKDISDLSQLNNVCQGVELIKTINQLPKKPKFIGFGSFAEYGSFNAPVKEDYMESPINLYGLSKLTFKKYSELLCHQNGINWTWIRPCYIYGPKDVKTRLIPTLINKFLNNEDIILDECKAVIDYLYIDDFVNLIYNLILTDHTGIYNLCSGKQYVLKDIIDLIYNLTNSKSNIIFDPTKNRINYNYYICGDNSKILKDTNIKVLTSLEEGLRKTINFYKNETSNNY